MNDRVVVGARILAAAAVLAVCAIVAYGLFAMGAQHGKVDAQQLVDAQVPVLVMGTVSAVTFVFGLYALAFGIPGRAGRPIGHDGKRPSERRH